MDNEREIKKSKSDPGTELVERSKMIFLQEIVEEFRQRQAQYDVAEEFAKTKKNRSIVVPGVILGLIALFLVVVVGVTRYIQTASRSIQVNIDDFADVNLREVLDEAQRLQNELDQAERELQQLQNEMAGAIESVHRERDRGIQLLANQGLSAANLASRENELMAQAESEVESIRAEYDPRIAEVEARIQDLQERIAQYDSRQLEQAREQEEILNNQQRIAELEQQEIRNSYEAEITRLTASYESEIERLESFQREFEETIRRRHAEELAALREQHRQEVESMYERYNPVFESSVGNLLNRSLPADRRTFGALRPYASTLGSVGVASQGEYGELQRRYDEIRRIINRMQEIPYENSVDTAMEQLEGRIYDVVLRYEQLWTGLRDEVVHRDGIIADQKQQIEEFRYGLDELTRINGETGYVLDPRDQDRIIVHIAGIRNVREGALGYVFRRDDEYIGSVRFAMSDGQMVAQRLETVEDQEIRSFDKILIEAQ